MLFTGSVVFVGSLVPRLLVLFVCLGFTLWGPGGVVWPLRAFSLVWSLLVYFLWFGLAGLGCSCGGWSFSFFFFFLDCYCFLGALYGVHPLHPPVNLQLCYLSFLQRSLSVFVWNFPGARVLPWKKIVAYKIVGGLHVKLQYLLLFCWDKAYVCNLHL